MKIALMPNLLKQDALKYSLKVIETLKKFGAEVLMYCFYKDKIQDDFVRFYDDFDAMMKDIDAVITLGGDGTIIHSCKHAVMEGKPVLGINVGRLGFMAGLETTELEKLECLINGEYTIEERMMLNVKVISGKSAATYYALNDAVISKGALSRIIDLTVKHDGIEMCKYRADGIIFATPTGSTAYSLSAGGPIIDPVVQSILLTPICPHSLVSRTIVFSKESTLEVEIARENESEIYLTVDGENVIELTGDNKVMIERAEIQVNLIKIKNKNFYSILEEKLTERRL